MPVESGFVPVPPVIVKPSMQVSLDNAPVPPVTMLMYVTLASRLKIVAQSELMGFAIIFVMSRLFVFVSQPPVSFTPFGSVSAALRV